MHHQELAKGGYFFSTLIWNLVSVVVYCTIPTMIGYSVVRCGLYILAFQDSQKLAGI
jgi:hypothetical protein